ncbi:MAG: hypothetical protein J0L64_26070 [Acidobacteria bacterium]|nr:hypothetical protein [Acidobacteriota bacterium]
MSQKIDAERAIYPRLEEAFDALKWYLARRPDSGYLMDDVHWLFKQSGDTQAKIPSLVAVYTFDHRQLEILHLLVRLPHL